jgi:hypothetical protein
MNGIWKRLSLAMLLLLPAAGFAVADATLSGRVQNSGGTPQMGAVVEAFTGGSTPVSRAYTDAKGQYTLRGLIPGTYFIKASATQFLPSVREGVIVKAGSHVMLNLTLNTLIEAFQLLPSRKAEVKGEDDWRWTLRSSANRPILRVVEDNGPLVVVSKAESPSDRALKARVAFMAGSDGSSVNGSDVKTDFLVEQSVFRTGTMAFSGNVGYNNTAGTLRTSYRHKTDSGSEPEISFTARRFASPDMVMHHAAVNALALALSDRTTIGDFLEAQYGGELQTVQFRGRVTAFRPYMGLTAHLDDNTLISYRYTTSRPHLRDEKGFDSSPSDLTETDPRVSLQGSLPRVEFARHHELALSKRIGDNNFQVAAFRDSLQNPALTGVGDVAFFDDDRNLANFLPDIYSSTFTFTGRNYSTSGVRAVAQHRFGNSLTTTLDYSFGGALVALPLDGGMGFKNQRLHSTTAKLSGMVPVTHTKWLTSYKWTSNNNAVTAVDLFNDSPGRSEPFLNLFLRQPIPMGSLLPAKMEALVDVRNLLAQGYVPMWAPDGRTLYLVQSPRSLRGGLAFNF